MYYDDDGVPYIINPDYVPLTEKEEKKVWNTYEKLFRDGGRYQAYRYFLSSTYYEEHRKLLFNKKFVKELARIIPEIHKTSKTPEYDVMCIVAERYDGVKRLGIPKEQLKKDLLDEILIPMTNDEMTDHCVNRFIKIAKVHNL